jgi:hypothetical protein
MAGFVNAPRSLNRTQRSDDVFCVYLAAEVPPPPNSYSPLKVVEFNLETGVVHATRSGPSGSTPMTYLPDPLPGASQVAATARSEGKRLIIIHCYCEPVAYELLIPLPEQHKLASWTIDRDWETSLLHFGSPSAREYRKFWKYPAHLRAADPRLSDFSPAEARNTLSRWVDFYFGVLMAASSKALNVGTDATGVRAHCFAVEVRREDSRMATIHHAFSYRIVSCEKLLLSEAQSWVDARQRGVLNVYDNLTNPPPGTPFPAVPLPILVFARADQTCREPRWSASSWNGANYTSNRYWFNRMSSPKAFMDRYVTRGVHLGIGDLRSERAPPFFRDSWGWTLVMNTSVDDNVLDDLPVVH